MIIVKHDDQLSEKERRLLDILAEDPGYTMLQLAEKMGVSKKTIGVYLKNLKEKSVIERVGSAKKGHWESKHDQN